MKEIKTILIILLFSISLNLNGQDLKKINTKDLYSISESFGLDSALNQISGMPIYNIDSITSWQLANQVRTNKLTNRIEYFLIDYALHSDKQEFSALFNDFLNEKIEQAEKYEFTDKDDFPEVSNEFLNAILKHKQDSTESLLIKYYSKWEKKSENYKSDYEQGITENNRRKKEKLMSPFQDCNFNCYRILLALDSLKSSFFDTTKLEYHNQYLKEYNRNAFIYPTSDFFHYDRSDNCVTVELDKAYKSLEDIDFKKNPDLKKLQAIYNKSYCWETLIFNEKIGFWDLGCQSAALAGHGVLFRIELKNTKLFIYEISSWIS